MDEQQLVAMSFNIRHGADEDGTVDLGRIAETVSRAGADVVGLQEVDRHYSPRSHHEDQVSQLAAALGMHSAFGANLDRDPPGPGAPRRQYGNAVLSRFPILEWSNTLLPRVARGGHQRGEQRGLLSATVDVGGLPLGVFSTHLQNGPRASRLVQVEAIRSVLAVRPNSFVLTGDLNATPTSPEVGTLADDLVDTWAVAGAGAGGGLTHPSRRPTRRIDYVLASADVSVISAGVLDPGGSDHLPVLATLAVSPRAG